MAITVKHNKVSTIPDTDDTSLVRPSDWNADHTLVGTIDVANGGTGASTLTGYVKGNGTSAMTASATIPSGDVTGLGTMSTQNANAVAITGGTINGTTIGATTASTGRFSDLTDTGLTSGRVVYASTGGNLVDASNFTYDGTNLVAGAIQNTPIGATTATTGAFTTLTSTGGAVNGTIGATTPAAGTFTTITGQTGVLRGTGNNLILRSQALTTSPWTLNASPTTASTTDPLGGSTATQFTTSANNSGVYQFPTVGNGITMTWSVYVRYISGDGTIRFGVEANPSTATVVFNSSAGTITSTGASLTATSVTNVGSGWYRVSGTFVSTSTTVAVIVYSNNTNASSFAAWGFQLEVGSVLNAYVATTTTAVYGTPTLSFSGVSTIGLESNGALFVQPAGTGALQAQATTSTTAGGNVRGANAVDWQTSRGAAGQVASGQLSFIGGGTNNTASQYNSTIAGGFQNTVSQVASFVGAGSSNVASGAYGGVVTGIANTTAGYLNFIGGGFTNSGTSGSAVTTQSGTMNATTAVTLSGSNASIKVGQYITGTSIAGETYVAAISGTALTLSKVASGSSTSTLSFFTPHGVVVGGGNNQATGSYSFIGGGGDAGTAANRNVASGDWSTVGGGRNNTASGIGSTIIGGYNPFNTGSTASGVSSVVLGGAGNIASGYYGVATGEVNTANGSYSYVFGSYGTTRSISGQISVGIAAGFGSFAQGRSQYGFLGLYAGTTDATPTILRSDANAASGTNQVILPNNSAYFFSGEVISGVTGGGNTKGWTIEGVIKRGANAAATTLVGSTVTSLYADAGAATWTIAVTADTTNGGLAVTFTGQASTTIRTVCSIKTTEVAY
jgi:hypothetical protein